MFFRNGLMQDFGCFAYTFYVIFQTLDKCKNNNFVT